MRDKLNAGFTKSVDEVDWKSPKAQIPRHRWYSYKEGFSPRMVERAIEEANVKKHDIVVDPFNGGGTTTLSCALLGIRSVGIEVNPFSKFVAHTKQLKVDLRKFNDLSDQLLEFVSKGSKSPLLDFSTFTEKGNNKKWLFNSEVLNAFEGGRTSLCNMPSSYQDFFTLALINAAMENSNAAKDGKCLKYKKNWQSLGFNENTFVRSLNSSIKKMHEDLLVQPTVAQKSVLIQGDCRVALQRGSNLPKFKLCITSPPYLNSFDYTDIYRPELFLGEFITTNKKLNALRSSTLRSHVEIKLERPKRDDFGILYRDAVRQISQRTSNLWDKQIPLMIQGYFEDIETVLQQLIRRSEKGAQIWIVVSNSAYADVEIPVDLIIADIGSRLGLYLREIGVMRHVSKRRSRHSTNISSLRESVVIFSNGK